MSENKMIFISHVDSLGGAETVLSEVIDNIKNRENIIIITNKRGNKKFSDRYIDEVELKRMHFGLVSTNIIKTILELPLTIFSIVKLVKIIKRNNVKLIYSNTSVNIIGIIAAKLTGINHIWHIHEQFSGFINVKLRLIYSYLMRYSKNTNVFISTNIFNEWRDNTLNKKGIIVGNPIKRSILSNRKNTSSLLLNKEIISLGFAGSLVENKNVILILKALRYINESDTRYKMVIAGDGNLKNELINYSRANNLQEKVDFIGVTNDMNSFYDKIDVLILPSYTEGVPLVVLEACINKKLVILTNNSGIGDVLEENIDYISIDPNDYKNLGEIITNIDKNRTDYYKIINNSYEKVEKYIIENDFNKKIINIINDKVN